MPNNNQSEEVERIEDKVAEALGYKMDDGEWKTYDFYGNLERITDDTRLEDIMNALTTHGASEYARGKSDELNRIRHIALTMGDCPVNDPMADAGWMHFQSRFVQALSQENTLKE